MALLNIWLRKALIIGVCAVPVIIPFLVSNSMFFPFITGKNFAFRIIVEILFAGWLIFLFNNSEYRPRFTKLTIAVLSLLGILVLATVFGENPYHSLWSNFERMDGLMTQIHLVAYFLIASSVLSSADLWRRFLQVTLFSSALMIFYSMLQISGQIVINQGGVRVDGRLGNATYLAVYTLFFIFFAVYFAFTTREYWLKWLYSLIGLGHVFILYKTATRGTMIGLIGGAILFGLLLVWRGQGKLRRSGFILAGSLLLLVGLFFGIRQADFVQNSPVLSRFAAISLTERTTESRFLIWQMSLQGFKEHPILGWGPENYNLVFDKYYNPKLWRQEPWFDRSHNVFFDWLINAGILGLVAYLSLFGLSLWYIWKSKQDLVLKSLLTSLLAGYFVHNIFVFDNLISYILFFSVLAWVNVVWLESKDVVSKNKFIGHRSEIDSLQFVFAGIVVLIMTGIIYFVNLRPIEASQTLIKGIGFDRGSEKSLANFHEVLSLNTFGSNEAREQLLQMALFSLRSQDISDDLKRTWLSFASSEMSQAIESGRQNNARSNLLYASFLSQLGELDPVFLDQALERLIAARQFSPKKQSILLAESFLYLIKGDKTKALEVAKEAFDLDPAYPEARKNYIVMAVSAGKDALVEELAAGSDDPNILFDPQLTNVYAELKRFDKILEIWQKQVELDPTNVQYRTSLAASYVQLGRRAEALVELQKILDTNPDENIRQGIENVMADIRAGRNPVQ